MERLSVSAGLTFLTILLVAVAVPADAAFVVIFDDPATQEIDYLIEDNGSSDPTTIVPVLQYWCLPLRFSGRGFPRPLFLSFGLLLAVTGVDESIVSGSRRWREMTGYGLGSSIGFRQR